MSGQSELQARYERIQRSIGDSCARHGRDRASVALLAVSKTFALPDVLALADLGQRAFGENYLQEAMEKLIGCRARRPDLALEWHFIGPIQSNKTRSIAEHFGWVHSVDRLKIAQRLSDQRPEHLGPLNLCLQVNIDAQDTKSGCAPGQVAELADQVASLPRVALRGLMAIPAPVPEPEAQRRPFAAMKRLLAELNTRGHRMDTLSMGMSADFDSAIAEGATMIRIGTALFGRRD